MPLYIDGIIKLVQVNNIKGNDKTQDFTYYTNFIQYTDRTGLEKVLEINSKEDFRHVKDQEGVAVINAYKTKAQVARYGAEGGFRDASLYKLSLSQFEPQK